MITPRFNFKIFCTVLFFTLIAVLQVAAQQLEYRITPNGKYQYLSNRQEAGMVFDESLGAFYKDITIRTFYLETQRKGYLDPSVSYDKFVKLDVKEQNLLLRQPRKELFCSPDNMSAECLKYQPDYGISNTSNTRRVDLSPKCPYDAPKSNTPFTTKLVIQSNDPGLQNNDCNVVTEKKMPGIRDETMDKRKTVETILGKP